MKTFRANWRLCPIACLFINTMCLQCMHRGVHACKCMSAFVSLFNHKGSDWKKPCAQTTTRGSLLRQPSSKNRLRCASSVTVA